jgi:hypothetical protein
MPEQCMSSDLYFWFLKSILNFGRTPAIYCIWTPSGAMISFSGKSHQSPVVLLLHCKKPSRCTGLCLEVSSFPGMRWTWVTKWIKHLNSADLCSKGPSSPSELLISWSWGGDEDRWGRKAHLRARQVPPPRDSPTPNGAQLMPNRERPYAMDHTNSSHYLHACVL